MPRLSQVISSERSSRQLAVDIGRASARRCEPGPRDGRRAGPAPAPPAVARRRRPAASAAAQRAPGRSVVRRSARASQEADDGDCRSATIKRRAEPRPQIQQRSEAGVHAKHQHPQAELISRRRSRRSRRSSRPAGRGCHDRPGRSRRPSVRTDRPSARRSKPLAPYGEDSQSPAHRIRPGSVETFCLLPHETVLSEARERRYLTASRSTTKISVSFGADHRWRAGRAVGEVRRDDQLAAAADLHAGDALVPAGDHFAGARA